jgi:hypothetical protein
MLGHLWNHLGMGPVIGRELPNLAVLSGGPMDGRQHPAEPDTETLHVVMTDGQQHLYQRTVRDQALPNGRTALIFEWKGRYFGPT